MSLEDGADVAAFQYAPDFAASGIEISPHRHAARRSGVCLSRSLPRNTFHGLPGLLADSLPDKFGNALIDAWLATQGRTPESFNAVERLCYTGARGMGALEFAPVAGPAAAHGDEDRNRCAGAAGVRGADPAQRSAGHRSPTPAAQKALRDILRVGTSAGGARAKAVIAWNRDTNEVRSGQVAAGEGFDYWLLKFDGVAGNKDKELEDPQGLRRHRIRLLPDGAGGGHRR